jgi:hypothetical protein
VSKDKSTKKNQIEHKEDLVLNSDTLFLDFYFIYFFGHPFFIFRGLKYVCISLNSRTFGLDPYCSRVPFRVPFAKVRK